MQIEESMELSAYKYSKAWIFVEEDNKKWSTDSIKAVDSSVVNGHRVQLFC